MFGFQNSDLSILELSIWDILECWTRFIFSIYDFFRRSRKKTSTDGFKWSDLVVVGW